jgi:integrase
MRKVLTTAALVKYRPSAQRREIPDAGMRGLRLLIHPSGARSWIMRLRRPDGRPAKLTLGSVDATGAESGHEPVLGGHLTLAAARRLAAEVRRWRAMGRDVVADYAAEKQRRKSAADERTRNSFSLAARKFVEEYAMPRTRRWKATARKLGLRPPDLDTIRGGLAERWAGRPVGEITGNDIHAVVDEVRRIGVPGLERRRARVSENQALAMFAALSKFFAWAIEQRLAEKNPCASVARPASAPARDRVLTDTEIRWFWAACDQVGPPHGALLKLLLLTGQRRDEVARMTRSEISADGATWTILGERTKNRRKHDVPLSPLAREILSGISGDRGFVFTTISTSKAVTHFSGIKVHLDKAMLAAARSEAAEAAIPPWRIHDLRRTVATGLQRLGVAMPVTEKVLNHVSGSHGGIAGVYQRHEYTNEKRAALEAWANLLVAIVSTTKPDDKVIKIVARRPGQ